jgi:hypothetical protein
MTKELITDMCKAFMWSLVAIILLSISQTYLYNQDYEAPEYEMRSK